MRAVIVGLGSIGRRHLANLRLLASVSHITVCHQRPKESYPANALSTMDSVVYSLEDALEAEPDIALITGPASSHIEAALSFARHGVHLFVEKPLSNELRGVDELLETCRRSKLVLFVGYNLRFYPPLQLMRQALAEGRIGRPLIIRAEVGQYLPEWRPGSDYRQSVSARSELGGGALLELSHELDYVCWLVGKPETVFARIDRLSDLEIDVEDSAEIVMTFSGGATGNIHLDMIDRATSRKCRIVGTDGTLTWDGITHRVRLFSAATSGWEDLHPAGEIDRNEMYLAELRHFLDCVEKGETPIVSGEDGRRVLEIALAVQRSSLEQQVISL